MLKMYVFYEQYLPLMNSFLRDLPAWQSGKTLSINGLFLFYDPQTDQEYKLTPDQLCPTSSGPGETGSDFVPIGATTSYPAFTTQDAVNRWLLARNPTVIQQMQAPSPPAAPTNGQVDDEADTFSFSVNPAYPSFAQYKVAGLPGVMGAVALDGINSYISDNRIHVKVVGSVSKGGLAVYVAGSGSIPDGKPLTNASPFTSTAVVVTPAPTKPDAPSFTGFDDVANTVSVSHATLPVSELVYDFGGATGIAVPLNNVISVGNAAGQVIAYARASGTRPEGLRANSLPFTVAATPTPGTTPPTVALSSPQSGQTLAVGSPFVLTASPTLGTNPLAKMEYLVDGVKLTETTVAPHSIQGNITEGVHNYTARALDTAGLSNLSNAVTISSYTASPVVNFSHLIHGGDSLNEVTFGAIAADTLEFNDVAVADQGDKTPVTMDLYLAGEYVASIPFVAYYNGKPFRYTHNGIAYTKNFAATRIDL
jgi:hypothetical protein